jgi:tetratricopeptide (TPR) repeat protein
MNRPSDTKCIWRWWPVWLVLAGALAVRLLHVYFTATRNPLASDLLVDAATYDRWARGIAYGGESITVQLMQAPVFPWFIAAVYKLFGPNLTAVRVLQAFMGTAACAFLIAITHSLFRSRAAALISGAISALYLPFIFYEGVLVPVTLTIFLNMFSIAVLATGRGFPGTGRLLIGGLLLGASIAAKPVAALLIPFAALHLYHMGQSTGDRAESDSASKTTGATIIRGYGGEDSRATGDTRRGLSGIPSTTSTPMRRVSTAIPVFLFGIVIAIAPVTVRNAAISGEFIPVTTGGGISYYLGNNPEANGFYAVPTYEKVYLGATPEDQMRIIEMVAEAETGSDLSPAEISRFWLGKGISYNRRHPRRFMQLLLAKALYFWNKHERANVENISFHRELPGPLGLPLVTFGILAPLGLLGIFLTRTAWRRLWLLYGGVLTYFAAALIFYVLARYRLPVAPFLICFAGAGIVELYRIARRRHAAELVLSLAALAVLAYFVNTTVAVDTPFGRSRFLTRLGNAYLGRGERDRAARAFREAVEVDPENEAARKALEETIRR